MILTRNQAQAIATGRKTTHHTTHTALRAGARLPIMHRAGKQAEIVCHAQIVSIEHRELRDLTRDEAKAEGYAKATGPLDFRMAWIEQHDGSWLDKTNAKPNITPTQLAALIRQRWETMHVGEPIAVLELQLVEAPDQYMAPSSGRLTKHQTTSNPRGAIDDAPVPPQDFVDALAKARREAWTTGQAATRREAAGESFERARRRAEAAGQNTQNAVRHVERITKALERAATRNTPSM